LLKIKISDAYVFKVIKIQVAVLWVMTPSSDVVGYQRFGEPCCLHLQSDEATRFSEMLVFYRNTTRRHNILIYEVAKNTTCYLQEYVGMCFKPIHHI